MKEILVHVFPLSVIGLLFCSGVAVIFYFNSLRKIQKYLETEYPSVWEELGKPNFFSKNEPEKILEFRRFLESKEGIVVKDAVLMGYARKTMGLLKTTKILVICLSVLFFITIFAVRKLSTQ